MTTAKSLFYNRANMKDTERLKEIKERKGYTLDHIAKDMGVHLLTIHRWIHGNRKPTGVYIRVLREWIERETHIAIKGE